MYTVIIAEDEWLVRLGIKTVIPWENYNMQVVADVDNGLSALAEIRKNKPDILLTDILMPQLSGEELIKCLEEENLHPYIIVITCMEDFHLVKTLLNHGIRDYISKSTVTEDELGKCLLRAREYLDSHSCRQRSVDTPEPDKMRLSSGKLQNYLHGFSTKEDTLAFLDSLDIRLDSGQNLLALCPIEIVYDYQGNILQIPPTELYRNLYDLVLSLPFPEGDCYPFLVDAKYFLLLFHYNTMQPDFCQTRRPSFCGLHEKLQDFLNIRLSLLIFPAGHSLDALPLCFEQAVHSLDRHYLHPVGSVLCSWEQPPEACGEIDSYCLRLAAHKGWIASYISLSGAEQFAALVEKLKAEVPASQESMTYALMSIAHLVGGFLGKQMEDNLLLCDKLILRIPHLPESVLALDTFLSSCSQYCLQYRKTSRRKEIREALLLIEENFRDPQLSLAWLARQVGLSETYFSTLFKQDLEQSFSKYLSHVRVEHSKTLLEHTDMKMFDIAIQCGFSDEAYFSRVFKKTAGIAPSEWRSLWPQPSTENEV